MFLLNILRLYTRVSTWFNPIQNETFQGCSQINGGQESLFSSVPKFCLTYHKMMKLGTVIPYPKKIQKVYESRDTAL